MNINVLVVDDEKPLRDFVRRNLEVRGYKVLTASNGLEALAIFKNENVQLVIMDIMMPHMDGWSVLGALKADPTTAELFGLAIDRVRDLPVLMVITFRPEFRPAWTGYPHVTSLTLSRLGQRQGARMVERLTGSRPLPAEVLERFPIWRNRMGIYNCGLS